MASTLRTQSSAASLAIAALTSGSTGVRYICRLTAEMTRSPSGAPIP